MSNYYQNPGNAPLRDYSPGPHSGVETNSHGHVVSHSLDTRARTALTLGLLSVVLSVLTGLPAIWVGRSALKNIDGAGGAVAGRWAAWTGIALGCLSVVTLVGAWYYLHTHG